MILQRFFTTAVSTLLLCLLLFAGCKQNTPPLPVLGSFDQDFSLTNQDGQTVTPATFKGKIYVADFFFTTCPTICPIMKVQMTRVYEAFVDNPAILLLSHTIDPDHDTVEVLHDFAQRLQIETSKWHMVTGPKSIIYPLAKKYMLGVVESSQAPGGYIHSGSFCLIDANRNIRGYYDGTDSAEVDQLIKDIGRLQGEK
ncbi:SCO family protein [Desulfogranum marinum]|uniref:SCO family protein n=1 Tax=Desulfogranum marinum TaxID=453220 RepID=UPI00196520B9|nr:SCO family protein [Desulfogranum marinum]MBM9514381.1 SCO family protein [Desulfogranum marinum]